MSHRAAGFFDVRRCHAGRERIIRVVDRRLEICRLNLRIVGRQDEN